MNKLVHPQYFVMMLTFFNPFGYIIKATALYELCKVTNDYIYIQTASKILIKPRIYIFVALITSYITKTKIIYMYILELKSLSN
jgi:hypothetical protein